MPDCILIDDERPALRELNHLLAAHADFLQVIGSFHRVEELLNSVDRLRPAVAFIDMQMPMLHGLELAENLRERLPNIALVFVTAHRQFAADAFDRDAIDYLLKPVTPERLAGTIARLIRHFSTCSQIKSEDFETYPVRIRTFGGLHVTTHVGPMRWHSAKTRELFAYLLHHRSSPPYQEQMLDDLYPDAIPEKAKQRLYNDRYQLRRQLQACSITEDWVRIDHNQLRIDSINNVFCDVDHYERLLAAPTGQTTNVIAMRQATSLVSGAYFQDAIWPWADGRRELLRTRQQRLLCQLAEIDQKYGRIAQSEAGLLHALENEPCDESAVTQLILLYKENGQSRLAQDRYVIYCKTLLREFQAKPGHALQAIANSLQY